MAKAYPMSQFVGYDYHEASIAAAREAAREAGVADRVRFEVATAKAVPPLATSTWFAASIACTTWAIPSARSHARARRSNPTER